VSAGGATTGRAALAVALAVSLSAGAAAAAWCTSLAPCALAPLWLLLPVLLRGDAAMRAPRTVRAAVALAGGWALACAGLLLVRVDAPWDVVMRTTPSSHPPFGEHPVTRRAGWPWPGVEGACSNSLGCDRVPFAMGVDALLVNLGLWSGLAWLLLRQRAPDRLVALVVPAALAAAVAGLVGGWQLVPMFD
jgi:hypothetical protein